MPRYADRHSTTRLYVGRLSSRTRSRDLDELFSRYGRVHDVDIKRDYAFVEFDDHRDADDARYALDGRDFMGSRIIVEFSKGAPRGGGGGSREYLGNGPAPGTGRCFNCGIEGHWARDCKAGDWKNKCYRCGDRGHIERNCRNSPRKTRRGRSYSRSPSPRRGRRHSPSRSRSFSRSPTRSRSRSPHRRVKNDEDVERSMSPYDGSPEHREASPPSRHSSRSRTPGERSPRGDDEANGGGSYGDSPVYEAGNRGEDEGDDRNIMGSPSKGEGMSGSGSSPDGGDGAEDGYNGGEYGHRSPQ